MPLMKKEELMAEAARLGVDLTDLTWPQQQKAVAEALKNEPHETVEEHESHADHPVEAPRRAPRPQIRRRVEDKDILISPMINSTQYQLIKYDEELGDELEVEEVNLDIGATLTQDMMTGTYRVKGKSGRKVVAQSTIPKENAQITFNPAHDMFPVVEWMGKRGYLWQHPSLPSVKPVLMNSGYYYEFADLFDSNKHPQNIWYSTGLICVSIPVVHNVMRSIEHRVADDRRRYE